MRWTARLFVILWGAALLTIAAVTCAPATADKSAGCMTDAECAALEARDNWPDSLRAYGDPK